MKKNRNIGVNILVIFIVVMLTISAASDTGSENVINQDKLKTQNRHSNNIVPVMVWHTVRQGGSSSSYSSGYSSRSSYGGGSSYGK